MKDVLIGIDAGTSVIKSVAFDLAGRQLAMASVPNDYSIVPGGGAEQDMALTWRRAATTLLELAERLPGLPERVAAIAVTAQGDGTWLIDSAGDPVMPGWLWLDARAGGIVEAARGKSEDRQRFELTGTGLNACQQGAQLQWIKRHAPEALRRTATAFHCKDWLYFRLTGIRATDPSEGTFTFGDFRTLSYSDEVVGLLDLAEQRRILPPMVDGLRQHDRLSPGAAAEIGLPAGTPVVLGYIDIVCTALGAGLYDPYQDVGCSIVGSTGMHMRLARTAADVALNDGASGYTIAMPVPGAYAQLQSNMAATLNIDWLLGLAGEVLRDGGSEPTSEELLRALDRWVAKGRPAALLYQPYISRAGERGPFVDPSARAGFIGLSLEHGFADLARAVLEGLAFAARDCYQAMGAIPTEIRLCGGAARSPAFRGIAGAACRADTRISRRLEAGAAGAAMIGAVSIGAYPSMEACCAEWVAPLLEPPETFDPQLAELYDSLFGAFTDAHEVLRPVWYALARRSPDNAADLSSQ